MSDNSQKAMRQKGAQQKGAQQRRHTVNLQAVKQAAAMARDLFKDRDALVIESKGLQDWVSNADRSVEETIRATLAQAFPDDSIFGEEYDDVVGSSGYTWVIDPIDGTTCFVNGMPGWCVVLACVFEGQVISAVIRDPIIDETFATQQGEGATLNGKAISVSDATALDQGTVSVGHSARVPADGTLRVLEQLLHANGIYCRSGSGALHLVYVAAGRVIGYCEAQMNAWDCIAALAIIEAAGGNVQPFDMQDMLAKGGRVVTACPGVYPALCEITDTAYKPS
ncbi:MAG: inositol monophosphatase family protein [Granulosicoccus sp.]